MAEEDYGVVPYRDLSELKTQLEGIQSKKDVSTKDLHDAVAKLAQSMSDMIGIFGAAAEQLKLEEKEREAEMKKHELIAAKLDKLLDQNKTIAEGMVAVVEMMKEKFGTGEADSKTKEELMFTKPEPKFTRQEWKPKPEIRQAPMPVPAGPGPMMGNMQPMPPPMPNIPPPPSNDFDSSLPPMQPAPMPDFDFPEEPNLEELAEPKKKGILGMFKK